MVKFFGLRPSSLALLLKSPSDLEVLCSMIFEASPLHLESQAEPG